MNVLFILLIHWFLALFCQSFFLHRYCSHRMFKMNFFWERFFYLLTYLTQGPSFLNPTSYSIMHQQHHWYSDTAKDPHSPTQSKSAWEMMKKTYHYYHQLLNSNEKINDVSIIHTSPKWRALDQFAKTYWSIFLWFGIYLGIYYFMNFKLVYYLFLPLHFFIGPIQGAIVNWFGHKVGYRNFSLNDESRNTLPLDLPLMGELYQNNHHRYGQRLNFAHRWFELDLTFVVAKFLSLLGIIKIKSSN